VLGPDLQLADDPHPLGGVQGAGRALQLPGALGLFAGDLSREVCTFERLPERLLLSAQRPPHRFGFALCGVLGDLGEGLGMCAERLRHQPLRAQSDLVQIERLEAGSSAGDLGCGHITSLS
jgi:hypothetical protein